MFSASIPFTKDSFMASVLGKRVVLSRNVTPSVAMVPVACIEFGDGEFHGTIKGTWFVEDGHVVLTDEWKKPFYIFRGIESRNGVSFLTGEPLLEANVSGFTRSVMYERVSLGDGFKVCISSHVDYADALGRLQRSLVRVGFPKERVVVVIGGSKEESTEVVDGWQTIKVKQSHDGFTALSAVSGQESPYWLLLHDTCEASDDFIDKMKDQDIGLNYDIILATKETREIGLYSSAFVGRLNSVSVFQTKQEKMFDLVVSNAKLWTTCLVASRKIATKDVYGSGVKRDVFYIDSIGVKKYVRATGMQAKP